MDKRQERWRSPGMRLAVLALIGIALYLMVIFVKQTVILYQMGKEVRAEEVQVERLGKVVQGLRDYYDRLSSPEGQGQMARESLAYVGPEEWVAVIVEEEVGTAVNSPETQEGTFSEERSSMPTWQQWLWVILYPASP